MSDAEASSDNMVTRNALMIMLRLPMSFLASMAAVLCYDPFLVVQAACISLFSSLKHDVK